MKMPEAWLRGAVPGIPMLLQPAAHALVQSVEDLKINMEDFREVYLWDTVANRASVGFHIQHMTGVIDRLFSYAAGKPLNSEQLEYLKNEGIPDPGLTAQILVHGFEIKVQEALAIFKVTTAESLIEPRYVGRKKLPSTVLGLYFHAAEHCQRHLGQLLVTVSVLKEKEDKVV